MPKQIIEEIDNIHDSGEHLVRIQEIYYLGEDDGAEIVQESDLNTFTQSPKGGWTLGEIGKRTRQLKKMIARAAAEGKPTIEIRHALDLVSAQTKTCAPTFPVHDAVETPAPPMTQEEINQKIRDVIVEGYKEEKRREFGDYFLNRHPGRHQAIKEAAEGTVKTVLFVDD